MTDNANLERVARAIHFTNIPDGEMASAEHWWRECRPHRLAQARAAIASLEAETAMRSAATIQSAPSKGVVERLRAKHQVYPATGGGSVSSDGTITSYVTDDGTRYVNPDGPEAAKLIESQTAEIEGLRSKLTACEARHD